MDEWWTVILFSRTDHTSFRLVKKGKIAKKGIAKIRKNVGRKISDLDRIMYRYTFQKEKPKY